MFDLVVFCVLACIGDRGSFKGECVNLNYGGSSQWPSSKRAKSVRFHKLGSI